jgi:hypothetical protein
MGRKKPSRQPPPSSPEPDGGVDHTADDRADDGARAWRRLWSKLRRRATPVPPAGRRTPPRETAEAGDRPSDPSRDYRHVKTIPFVLESRYRTVNAALLLIVVAGLIMIASPAATQVVTDHAAFLSGLVKLATDHPRVTATILASFAGRVGWTAWKGSRNR